MNSIELYKNKRVLVTGGAGFIGGTLIRKLLKSTNWNIFNLDKLGYASDLDGINQELSNLDQCANERYEFLKIDLVNSEMTNYAMKVADPDLIIHLAAESHVDRSIVSPSSFLESNVMGTFNLLQAAREHFDRLQDERKKNFRLHHVSTDEVYGSLGKNGYFSEASCYGPRSPYSASKAASDHLVNAWHSTYGLPVVITNCSNNFGPWQFLEKLIPMVITNALGGKDIPLYGDGTNVRDWLFVEDHVDALMLVATKGRLGSSYCIGGGAEKKNIEVMNIICSILDLRLKPNKSYKNLIKNVNDRPGHDYRYAIDSSLIFNELGWRPNHNFQEAMEKTVDWYLNNLEWCKKIIQK
tara:strand:- start:82 stop:1143 length:1062 start_codon:yes stop_codon:yes gene_type:complete